MERNVFNSRQDWHISFVSIMNKVFFTTLYLDWVHFSGVENYFVRSKFSRKIENQNRMQFSTKTLTLDKSESQPFNERYPGRTFSRIRLYFSGIAA